MIARLATAFAATAVLLFAADETRWSFEDPKVGSLPEGWTAARTGEGEGSEWKIVEYEAGGQRNQALAQVSSAGKSAMFNLCVLEEINGRDVDLAVDVKAAGGKIDQGGGLVWRYRDANNYYITRWNPLENNFRVYKVVAGKRMQLATARAELPADKWHTVRAVQSGDTIKCYLDGKLLLEATDDAFKEPGLVGLWTKADAVTWFDNLVVVTK